MASISTLQLKGPKASITLDDDSSTDDGTLGSEVLQQFNILLDARSGSIYLRPNRRFVANPAG